MDKITVPKKDIVYELFIQRSDINWNEPFTDRCTVRKPMMRSWLHHKCEYHDVLIEWR